MVRRWPVETAIIEVAHHLRREAVDRSVARVERTYRAYTCALAGSYLDISGEQTARPELYASDSYAASQTFGEAVRASRGRGIIYDSLRHAGGVNVVAYRPTNVLDVTQADHFEVAVEASSKRIEARRLTR